MAILTVDKLETPEFRRFVNCQFPVSYGVVFESRVAAESADGLSWVILAKPRKTADSQPPDSPRE